MIVISFLLMLVLFIIAGATQFWLLAMIGVGIFARSIITIAPNTSFVAIKYVNNASCNRSANYLFEYR